MTSCPKEGFLHDAMGTGLFHITESFAKILTNLGLEENKDFDKASMNEVPKREENFDLTLCENTEAGELLNNETDYY